jgi:hypothetical protein
MAAAAAMAATAIALSKETGNMAVPILLVHDFWIAVAPHLARSSPRPSNQPRQSLRHAAQSATILLAAAAAYVTVRAYIAGGAGLSGKSSSSTQSRRRRGSLHAGARSPPSRCRPTAVIEMLLFHCCYPCCYYTFCYDTAATQLLAHFSSSLPAVIVPAAAAAAAAAVAPAAHMDTCAHGLRAWPPRLSGSRRLGGEEGSPCPRMSAA